MSKTTIKPQMICLREDGTEIERRDVTKYARFSMQAAYDHKAANKAKAEIGADLHSVRFPWVLLHFDINGQSYRRSEEGI